MTPEMMKLLVKYVTTNVNPALMEIPVMNVLMEEKEMTALAPTDNTMMETATQFVKIVISNVPLVK